MTEPTTRLPSLDETLENLARVEARWPEGVRIAETRPLSKLKRWRLVEVVARSTRVVE